MFVILESFIPTCQFEGDRGGGGARIHPNPLKRFVNMYWGEEVTWGTYVQGTK